MPAHTARTTRTARTRLLAAAAVLLTAVNTGKKACTLPGFPDTSFGPDRIVARPAPESKPTKPVKLAPGERGYAGLLLSSADGSGKGGATATTLEVAVSGEETGAAAEPVTVRLPAKGVHVDDSAVVTYWLSTVDTALAW